MTAAPKRSPASDRLCESSSCRQPPVLLVVTGSESQSTTYALYCEAFRIARGCGTIRYDRYCYCSQPFRNPAARGCAAVAADISPAGHRNRSFLNACRCRGIRTPSACGGHLMPGTRIPVVPAHHFMLILGRAIKPFPHWQASLPWSHAFDPFVNDEVLFTII